MASTDAKRAWILIAEADSAYAAQLARVLRPRADPVVVGTLKEARAALAARPHWAAAVVADPLPDGSGLDVVEALAACAVPALVLVSTIDPSASHRAYVLGASLVVRPVDHQLVLLFAQRALDVRPSHQAALLDALREWDSRYRLAPAQSSVLARMARGATRDEVAVVRRVTSATVKKDINRLLAKTEHRDMPEALHCLHAEVIARMEGRAIDEPAASETRLRSAAPLSAADVTRPRRSG